MFTDTYMRAGAPWRSIPRPSVSRLALAALFKFPVGRGRLGPLGPWARAPPLRERRVLSADAPEAALGSRLGVLPSSLLPPAATGEFGGGRRRTPRRGRPWVGGVGPGRPGGWREAW